MSNPTSNFGWQMPTPTDLVTDLPADFEVFGQAVDSSLADLKGGTSGQILAKNSNTDMDFVWTSANPGDITGVTAGTGISGGGTSGDVTITNSMATEITAKGDLIVGTGSATFDNLAAGANGSTLVADSSTSTGLRYQAPVNVNPVINSAFQIWQRGTSIAVTSGAFPYTADRWNYYPNGANNAQTVSRQATNDTTNLPNIQYCGRFQRNSGQTGTGAVYLCNSFETINSMPYVGKTVTFSFYARAGANFSSASNVLAYKLYSGTGTDQLSNTGYTGATAVISSNATLTTTWQRFTATGTVGTSATELSIEFSHTPSGTAGAADYYEITGVQLEVGSVATPFKTYGGTIQGELAACQRYYSTSIPAGYTITDFPVIGTGTPGIAFYATGSNDAFGSWQLPVEMRTTPTTNIYSSSNRTSGSVRSATTGTDYTCGGFGFSTGNRKGSIYLSGFGAGVSSGLVLTAQWTASAEL